MKVKVRHVQLLVIPWSIQSMEFFRPEYWSGLPCPPPRDLPDPGSNPHLSCLLHRQVGSLPLDPPNTKSHGRTH